MTHEPPASVDNGEAYRGFQSAVAAIRSWAAGFSDDMTQRRLRAVAQDLEDNRSEILGASTPPARPGREEDVTCDSADYKHDFYGILNAQGKFWTPLAHAGEQEARQWLEAFVAKNPKRFSDMLTTHKIVPVRIQLAALFDGAGA